MKCMVTGAAGFLGSHLSEELLRQGHTVVGIDAFLPTAPTAIKAENQYPLLMHPQYHFHAIDLRYDPLDVVSADIDVLFHLAGFPDLPLGWDAYELFLSCNQWGTHRLLEAVRAHAPGIKRFILGSSYSVYGRCDGVDESARTRPVTPYGVSKLAAEQLAQAAADQFALPLVILRYFPVFGPRQRPDMAYSCYINQLLLNQPLQLLDDGVRQQCHLFIADCIRATLAAIEAPIGEIYNVCGDQSYSHQDVISCLEEYLHKSAECVRTQISNGEGIHLTADNSKIRRHFNWKPLISLEDGLKQQCEWQQNLIGLQDVSCEMVKVKSWPSAQKARKIELYQLAIDSSFQT